MGTLFASDLIEFCLLSECKIMFIFWILTQIPVLLRKSWVVRTGRGNYKLSLTMSDMDDLPGELRRSWGHSRCGPGEGRRPPCTWTGGGSAGPGGACPPGSRSAGRWGWSWRTILRNERCMLPTRGGAPWMTLLTQNIITLDSLNIICHGIRLFRMKLIVVIFSCH